MYHISDPTYYNMYHTSYVIYRCIYSVSYVTYPIPGIMYHISDVICRTSYSASRILFSSYTRMFVYRMQHVKLKQMYVYVCTCVYICICIYIYISLHTHTYQRFVHIRRHADISNMIARTSQGKLILTCPPSQCLCCNGRPLCPRHGTAVELWVARWPFWDEVWFRYLLA